MSEAEGLHDILATTKKFSEVDTRPICTACKAAPAATATGRCEPCELRADREKGIDRALRSIPRHYAWASVTAKALYERVGSVAARMNGEWHEFGRDDEGRRELRLVLDSIVVRPQPRIVFMGALPGHGKTSLGCALLRSYIERAYAEGTTPNALAHFGRARFLSAYWAARVRQTHPLGHGEPEEITSALHASVLLLDDLGTEVQKDASGVADILYERFNQDRPTWMTTWMNFAELRAHYGAGIERRIGEGAVIFRFEE